MKWKTNIFGILRINYWKTKLSKIIKITIFGAIEIFNKKKLNTREYI